MIPSHLLLPQDKVWVRDKGPKPDDESDDAKAWRARHKGPHVMVMDATDAKHAVSVEPERYEFHDPSSEEKPALRIVENTEIVEDIE